MNILVIPVQSVSDLITILNTFTSGFRYPEVFSLKDFREWRN